ncbi:MAG: hypothetical protein PHE84_00555 [bacterium]|nr:hypothetical protein [bacterium]
MRKKSLIIGLCGFFAGIAFVIQCGNDAKSIAGKIATALDISFDNSGTNLASQNVQDAISEISSNIDKLSVKKSLYIKDGDGNLLGIFIQRLYGGSYEYFSIENNSLMEINSFDGSLCSDLRSIPAIYFMENDCVGNAYSNISDMWSGKDKIFCGPNNSFYKISSVLLKNTKVISMKTVDSITKQITCSNNPYNFNIDIAKLEQITLPKIQYTLPITIEAR